MREKRSQKGAGACSGKAGDMPGDPDDCQERIAALRDMKQWLETVLRIMEPYLSPDMKAYFQQGVLMLSNDNTLFYIARTEDLFHTVIAKKDELMILINRIIQQALQNTNDPTKDLFMQAKDVPSGSIPLTYALVMDADTNISGCESCLITMEDIEPAKAVKISHSLNGTPFSICLSNKIFDEPAIKDALEKQRKIYMKHPLLRDKAYINLELMQSVLQGKDNTVYKDDLLLRKENTPSTSQAPQSGGLKLKRTDKKIILNGRERTVYVGKHNKQFVQLNRQYVPVASLTTHKKASKERL